MNKHNSSKAIHDLSSRYIPGSVCSMNRQMYPSIAFARGKGAYIWDADGKRYVDFHAAFGPHLLGHNHPEVNQAVKDAIDSETSLFGSGPTELEAVLAQLICESIRHLDKVTFLNTGSEATSLAIKLSRAWTGKDHFIVMQGGYNGNGDELACNVFNTLEEIGARVSPGEYPMCPLGAGTVVAKQGLVHVVNFNDLDSIRTVCQKYPIAAVITEPVLQNIGVVKPGTNYLRGLRDLATEQGFVLIFDEVKTGFRTGLGGYAETCGIEPDLVTYGKAIANGYPMSVLGGKAEIMDRLAASHLPDRPYLAGTYNGHPVALSAALATFKILQRDGAALYGRLDELGRLAEEGMQNVFRKLGIAGTVSRSRSALSYYFMEKNPADFHDILTHHDFELDALVRRALVNVGIYFVPIATKQLSISLGHSPDDIGLMIEKFEACLTEQA